MGNSSTSLTIAYLLTGILRLKIELNSDKSGKIYGSTLKLGMKHFLTIIEGHSSLPL